MRRIREYIANTLKECWEYYNTGEDPESDFQAMLYDAFKGAHEGWFSDVISCADASEVLGQHAIDAVHALSELSEYVHAVKHGADTFRVMDLINAATASAPYSDEVLVMRAVALYSAIEFNCYVEENWLYREVVGDKA